MLNLALACIAFVGTHFLLSHPLRQWIWNGLGWRGFMLVYNSVAIATFGWMLWTYRSLGDQQPLWNAGPALWSAAALLMWFGSILFAGSFVRNPALVGGRRQARPTGVLAITRHPMMWGFAIWALVHLAVVATPKALLLDGTILLLALGGSVGQDRKKGLLMGTDWHDWTAQTAFMPFGRGLASPGLSAIVAGTVLLVIALLLHPAGAIPWPPWKGIA